MHYIERAARRLDGDYYLKPPHAIYFHITYRCNRRCAYCANEWLLKRVFGGSRLAGKSELSARTIKRILREAREAGVKLFQIDGGEPFLREDIYEIIQYGVSLGLNVFPITKYGFSDEEVQRLADTGLKYIGVSLDSLSAKTNRLLHGSASIKTELVRDIRLFLKAGMKPIVSPVVCQLNRRQYEGFVRALMDVGVKYINPMIINSAPFAIRGIVAGVHESLVFNEEETELQRMELDRINKKYGVGELSWWKPPLVDGACVANRAAMIHPDGTCIYCLRTPDLSYGNVRRRKLMDVWRSKKRRDLMRPSRYRFRGTKCFDCEKFDLCNKLGRCYFDTLHERTIYQTEERRLCPWFKGAADS